MFRLLVTALVVSVALSVQAQTESPMTPVDFEKLRIKTLDQKQTSALPQVVRKVLGLPDVRIAVKQLVAGDATQKYFFMLRVEDGVDNVILPVVDPTGTRVFLTTSKLDFRGAAASIEKGPLHGIQGGDPKSIAEFNEVLAVWSQVAQSLE
jgi:hypothetical protein